MYFAVGATIGVHQVMTSIGSKQKLIENSFDICTKKVKIDIFAFLYSWLVFFIKPHSHPNGFYWGHQ